MEIFNTQEVIKDENKLVLTFEEGATFDDGLLERTDLSFQQLTPDKHVYVECVGFIPIELLAYLLEVSTHCSMTITIHDDLEASVFLAQIKNAMNLNVNIIVNND
jgi:hypothetical protein